MQDIIIYLRAGDVLATLVDIYNQKIKTTPSITRGSQANLCLRILNSDATPWAAADLDFASWDFVMASDWLSTTDPQIRVQSGITVAEVIVNEITYSEICIPLTETNTAELITALGNNEKITLGAELAGFAVGESEPALLIQFNINVRNRRGTAGTGTPEPVGDGTYSSSQTDALLSAKADKVGSADIEITAATKGLILPDRTTSTRYRVFIDNGILGIETIS